SSIARLRAYVESMRGNIGLASALAETAKGIAREIGLDVTGCLTAAYYVAMHGGDYARAEEEMREAIDTFRAMGDLGHLASYGPSLADALIPQGRFEEALMLTKEAERVAIQGDMDAQVHWRRVRAKIFAHRERLDEAIALATAAASAALSAVPSGERPAPCPEVRRPFFGRPAPGGCPGREATTRSNRRGRQLDAGTRPSAGDGDAASQSEPPTGRAPAGRPSLI